MEKVRKNEQLSEAIEKTLNAIDVINLYQSMFDLASAAKRENDPSTRAYLLEESINIMFNTNQTLLKDLGRVAVTLYRVRDGED